MTYARILSKKSQKKYIFFPQTPFSTILPLPFSSFLELFPYLRHFPFSIFHFHSLLWTRKNFAPVRFAKTYITLWDPLHTFSLLSLYNLPATSAVICELLALSFITFSATFSEPCGESATLSITNGDFVPSSFSRSILSLFIPEICQIMRFFDKKWAKKFSSRGIFR